MDEYVHDRESDVEDSLLIISLENRVASLEVENAELHRQMGRQAVRRTDYTMEQFLIILFGKLGRTYGWKQAYMDASKKLRQVDHHTVKEWQWENKVPAWAVEQIQRMEFNKWPRNAHQFWTVTERAYLVRIHLADLSMPNDELAELCTEEFGRTITENAIRGALHRARMAGVVPDKRPKTRFQTIHQSSNRTKHSSWKKAKQLVLTAAA